ncbi:histidine kinase [Schizophyllum fasciatum]
MRFWASSSSSAGHTAAKCEQWLSGDSDPATTIDRTPSSSQLEAPKTRPRSLSLANMLPLPVLSARQPADDERREALSASLLRKSKSALRNIRSLILTDSPPSSQIIDPPFPLEDKAHPAPAKPRPDARAQPSVDVRSVVDEVIVDKLDDPEASTDSNEDSWSPPGTSSMPFEESDQRDGFAHDTALNPPTFKTRAYRAVGRFFTRRFGDEETESNYVDDQWYATRNLRFLAAVWFIVVWALGIGFAHPLHVLMDKIWYYGVGLVCAFAPTFLIVARWHKRHPILYQIVVCVSTWSWSFYVILSMYFCGFYDTREQHTYFSCDGKDYIAAFYYFTALQTTALFGLNLHRLPALLGMVSFYIVSMALIVPDHHTWTRSMINFLVFHIFLLILHYHREDSERRLFKMRTKLRKQYRDVVAAQYQRTKAYESKARLTSYVFHDKSSDSKILAVQNIEATGAIDEQSREDFEALKGGLSNMSQVLNDVLDFNRLDSGRFEFANAPFAFHQAVRSLIVPLEIATNARNLKFKVNVDPNIDKVARQAAYCALGKTPEEIGERDTTDQYDGFVVGDQARLRQVITNLTSNACKFTPEGGSLTLTTKLLKPAKVALSTMRTDSTVVEDVRGHAPLSQVHLEEHNRGMGSAVDADRILVRVEISDTGVGIKHEDIVQGKLFSPFNQTSLGIQQGGKGSGLGLALVRSIVKQWGGRLGVKSKVGEGSTFWFDVPLGVGNRIPRKELEVLMADVPGKGAVVDAGGHEPYALRPSQIKLSEAQSSAAMKGLMEQAGHVNISLPPSRRGGHTRRPSAQLRRGSQVSSSVWTSCSPSSMDDSGAAGSHRRRSDASESYFPEGAEAVREDGEGAWKDGLAREDSGLTARANGEARANGANGDATRTNGDAARGGAREDTPGASSVWSRPTPSPSGLPVLVVEDDDVTRSVMVRTLQRLGCDVTTAYDGMNALEVLGVPVPAGTPGSIGTPWSEKGLDELERRFAEGADGAQGEGREAEEGPFALVLLDNQMPRMFGTKVAKYLRRARRRDFVVGLTGNAMVQDQKEFIDAGADRVYTKPTTKDTLLEVLAAARERRKAKTAAVTSLPIPIRPPPELRPPPASSSRSQSSSRSDHPPSQ